MSKTLATTKTNPPTDGVGYLFFNNALRNKEEVKDFFHISKVDNYNKWQTYLSTLHKIKGDTFWSGMVYVNNDGVYIHMNDTTYIKPEIYGFSIVDTPCEYKDFMTFSLDHTEETPKETYERFSITGYGDELITIQLLDFVNSEKTFRDCQLEDSDYRMSVLKDDLLSFSIPSLLVRKKIEDGYYANNRF